MDSTVMGADLVKIALETLVLREAPTESEQYLWRSVERRSYWRQRGPTVWYCVSNRPPGGTINSPLPVQLWRWTNS